MLNATEDKLMAYFRNKLGSFSTHLFNTIFKADMDNREKLRLGFPDEVDIVLKYQNEPGYAEDLESRYNKKYNV